MKHYKVWIEVEEIDEENDHYEKYGEPIDIFVSEFPERAEAIKNQIVSLFNELGDIQRNNAGEILAMNL